MKKLALSLLLGAAVVGATLPPLHLLLAPSRAHAAEITVSGDDLKDVPLLPAQGAAKGLALLVSDAGGWSDADEALAGELSAAHIHVLKVDLERWRKVLDAEDGDCVYLGSDIEKLAGEALSTLGSTDYFRPLVIGRGEGGTLAYAAVADEPDNTAAGGVAFEPAPVLRTKLPVCAGATFTPAASGGFFYAPSPDLPAPMTFIAPTDFALPMAGESGETTVRRVPEKVARERAVVAAAVDLAQADAGASDLPIVSMKASGGAPKALAVIWSGDGGWRDIDEEIGRWMAAHGVEVVGLDSLRYFWSEKDPATMSADLADAVHAADPAGRLPVILAGFSFGADTLPFAWADLPADIKARTALIGLLSPERTTPFEIRLSSFLGLGGEHDVLPALLDMPAEKVICFYGTDEAEGSACTDPRLTGVHAVGIDGGHHFDGDFEGLARTMMARAGLGAG